MTFSRCNITALALLFLALFSPVSAHAQYNFLDPFQSGLDRVVRGLDYIGDRASDILGPGLGIEGKSSEHTLSRATEEQYPVGPELTVSLENEFGRIHLRTWPERVVKVETEIFVGAQGESIAQKVLDAITVHVEQGEKTLDIRTFLPDTRQESGLDSIEVHYTLLIPNNAGFICKNFFGDTQIREVGGPLTVDAQYGVVELENIGGPVKLRMLGEFPLRVRGLKQGGVFNLSGAQADFSELQGLCQISNFRGGVTLHSINQDAVLEVNSDSGTVHLMVPQSMEPDLVATTEYGTIEASYPMTRVVTGAKTLAYSRNAEAIQHIKLNAVFGEIRVDRAGATGDLPENATHEHQAFNDIQTERSAFPEGFTLEINATVGDIHVEGADTDVVEITATRIAWVKTAGQAPAALEALLLETQSLTDRLSVRTVATGAMQGLDCAAYRVDLRIRVPRTAPIEIFAENGFTSVKGMGDSVRVNQSVGDVVAQHNKGTLNISSQKGNVSVSQCGGDTDVSTRYGTLSINEVYGKVTANCSQGDTIVESLKNDMLIRNNGGGVRILALDGLTGSLDVLVVRGDLRILMPEMPDAELHITAKNGRVQTSRFPLSGIITNDTHEFESVLGNGTYSLRLATHDGDVILD